MNLGDVPTERLLELAKAKSPDALEELFRRHQERLGRMIAVRMDSRLQSRVDVSDIVQETLIEAHRQIDQYLSEQPIAFYPWLRQIAWNKMIDVYRRHITAQGRDVSREQNAMPIADESAMDLMQSLAGSITTPSQAVARDELHQTVRRALDELGETDRELIVMRHLERLTTREAAEALGITEAAVKTRLLRALQRLRKQLGHHGLQYE